MSCTSEEGLGGQSDPSQNEVKLLGVKGGPEGEGVLAIWQRYGMMYII